MFRALAVTPVSPVFHVTARVRLVSPVTHVRNVTFRAIRVIHAK